MADMLSSEFVRTVTAADPDGSLVQQIIVQGGQSVRVGASCNQKGATLSGSLYFLNSLMQPVGVAKITFTAGASPDWNIAAATSTAPATGTFVAVPNYDPCWPLGGAKGVAFKADTVSGGSWTIAGTIA